MEEFKTMDDILQFAMDEEQKAVDFYAFLAKNARNEDMRDVFEGFSQEEVGHKARLARIREQGLYPTPAKGVADLKIADYQIDVDPHPDMDYQQALVVAMNKEKAAFRLYSDLAKEAPSNEMKELFQSLALEESKHKLRFELEYDDNVLREN
ncbi:MAG: ferritin family protein [Bacteroidales bacterium]|nr:ferritin family protein [Bacteroidales bacterium]